MSERDNPGSGRDEQLDLLDAEAVEDLDVSDDADDVRGGTTFRCPTSH